MRNVILGASAWLAGCSSAPTAHECVDAPGTACTWAGIAGVQSKDLTVRDRRETPLNWPTDIGFSPLDDAPYVVDWNNFVVRRVKADDTMETVMGNHVEGEGAPNGEDYLPPSAPLGAFGPTISLNHPTNLDFLPDGRLIIASWHGLRVRVLEPSTLRAYVIAGDGEYGSTGDGGPAYRAELNLPRSVAVAPSGQIFLLDQKNQRVRTFTADVGSTITTIAGTGASGFAGDGGPASEAQLAFVTKTSLPSGGLALDANYLYIADNGNSRIRRVQLDTGMIDTVAGNGTAGLSGDGGPATAASLNSPADLAIGPDGALYIADSYNNVIRRVDLATNTIETVAGTGAPCAIGATCLEEGEGMPARDVVLNGPLGLGFDGAGNLYIADTYNNRIVRIARDW